MESTENFVRAALGKTAEAFNYTCGGKRRNGWVKRFKQDVRTFTSKAYEAVEEHWRAMAERDIRLFQGAGPQVFALPRLPVLDVIEFAEVGAHNAMPDEKVPKEITNPFDPGDVTFASRFTKEQIKKLMAIRRMTPRGKTPWKYVRLAMQKIMRVCPFEIQVANQANLRATFLNPVSFEKAKNIGEIAMAVNAEGIDVAIEELKHLEIKVPVMKEYADIPDFEKAMATYISKLGKLLLWWD